MESTKMSSEPSAIRQTTETCSQYIPSPWFWDNLSKVKVCPRALREFDRRTKPLIVLPPPKSLNIKSEQLFQLQRLARQGGFCQIDLRGYSRLLAPSSTTYQISKTDTRVKKGFFDVAFSQYLSDNGIYLTDDWDPAAAPSNHAEIKNRLAQRRRSLSPSALTNTDYVKFQKQNHWAQNAQSVMQDVLPVITGHSDIPHSGGFFFKNLKPLTDKSLNLQPAFPDSYDGCHPEELDRSIREQLGEYIIPLSERNVPCLPTYFTVLMGPDDTMPVGYRQILYEGSLGARAVHQLRCFISNAATALDNNAYVLAALYNSSFGSLWIYAIRPVAASQNSDAEFPIEYRITLIDSFHLTKSPDDLRDGISAWRNAREWAKEKRDELVKAANMKAASFRSSSTGAGVGSSADRDGSE